MKKILLTYAMLLGLFSAGFSQNAKINLNQFHPLNIPNGDINSFDNGFKKAVIKSKKFGDTLFYEDFANPLSTGWRIVNNNRNNFVWKWDTIYRAGQFSTTVSAINSTSATNGFMSLTADFYNTPIANGGVPMDTYFESPPITVASNINSVWLNFQQYLRYCCSSANKLVVQVSVDNFNSFEEFDATNDLPVNATNANNTQAVANNLINITCALKGDSIFKMRFLSEGNSHYFWMIDDVAVIEGPHNDLELTQTSLEFNYPRYFYNPIYTQIPFDLFTPLSFSGRIKNNGDYTQTNARLQVSIDHNSFPNGSSGNGLVYASSQVGSNVGTLHPNILFCDNFDTIILGSNTFIPTVAGSFTANWLATGDSIDENPGNETAVDYFATSDTIYARDDNTFGGGTGPSSYVSSNGNPGGTAVGDKYGTMFIIESRNGNGLHTVPSSVTFRVSSNMRNVGVEIAPKIWAYNEDSLINGVDAAFGAEVASSFIPYTVTANSLDTFLTLKFDNGLAIQNGLDTGQYVVGWEVTSIANNTTFEVLNDASTAAKQKPITTFVNFGHNPSWGWVNDNPGIRLNLKSLPLSTSLKNPMDSNLIFKVYPNPSNGEFKVEFQSNKSTRILVTNTLNQTVYSKTYNSSGNTERILNLKYLKAGIYLIRLESEGVRSTKKLIIR